MQQAVFENIAGIMRNAQNKQVLTTSLPDSMMSYCDWLSGSHVISHYITQVTNPGQSVLLFVYYSIGRFDKGKFTREIPVNSRFGSCREDVPWLLQ